MRAALLLMALAGCAVGPGEPMGTIEPRIEARLSSAPGRDTPDGFQRLASDYQVRVTRFTLTAPEFLLSGGSDAVAGGFDPANPPPGFSNCHGGHCHGDDGSLVAYEELAARAGGGATSSTALVLRAGELDLVEGTELPSPACEPECTLGETAIRSVSVPITALTLEGVVRDGRTPARLPSERPFRLTLGAPGTSVVTLSSELDLPIDRENPPHIALTLRVEPTAALFDQVDWAAAEVLPDGTIDLGAPGSDAARTSIIEGLSGATIDADVQRTSP